MSDDFDPFKDEKDAAKRAFRETKRKVEDNKPGAGIGAIIGAGLGAAVTKGGKGAGFGAAAGGLVGAFVSDQIRKNFPVGGGEDAPPPRVKRPDADLWKHLQNKEEPKKKDKGNDPEPGL